MLTLLAFKDCSIVKQLCETVKIVQNRNKDYLSWRIYINTLIIWRTLVVFGHNMTGLIAVPYETVAIVVCHIVDRGPCKWGTGRLLKKGLSHITYLIAHIAE